jgi:hypothetical protein
VRYTGYRKCTGWPPLFIIYYLQPWAFIRMPNIILVCVATPLGLSGPDTIRNGLRRASIQKIRHRRGARIENKYIYIYKLNGIEFSQLRSRRPNIDYTGLEGFSDRGLLDGVQKRVKGSSCTYVTASNKCHTYTSSSQGDKNSVTITTRLYYYSSRWDQVP